MNIDDKNKPILTDEQVEICKEWYAKGAPEIVIAMETGIPIDDIIKWRAYGDNDKIVKQLRYKPLWKAEQMFLEPTNHKEATEVLRRHPLTKKDYSDRTEVTGAEGADLKPILVQFINSKNEVL